MRFGVDSGAAVTAIPRKLASDYPVTENPSGSKYLSATGEPISDEGQRKLLVEAGGELRGIRSRVAAVRRPLMAVYDMVHSGHRVVFERDAEGRDISHAVHIATGRRVTFTPRQRTWDLDVDIIPACDVREMSKNFRPVTANVT